jgi:hypothetical protein
MSSVYCTVLILLIHYYKEIHKLFASFWFTFPLLATSQSVHARCVSIYLDLAKTNMCLNHIQLLCKMLYFRTCEEYPYRCIRQNEQRKQATKRSLHICWTDQC